MTLWSPRGAVRAFAGTRRAFEAEPGEKEQSHRCEVAISDNVRANVDPHIIFTVDCGPTGASPTWTNNTDTVVLDFYDGGSLL